jgi:hypothetical protein
VFVNSIYPLQTDIQLLRKEDLSTDLICRLEIVCILANRSRTDKLICTEVGMLLPWDQEGVLERPELQKMCSGFEFR